MASYGKPSGRDLTDHLLLRLQRLERELADICSPCALSTLHRGDTAAVPAPVEGQTMIQHDTDAAHFYSNGSWSLFHA